MDKIQALLDKVIQLCESKENERRCKLWSNREVAIRRDAQWHGIPAKKSTPVTFNINNSFWAKLLNFRLDTFYYDPDRYLEGFLKLKIERFCKLRDDTPIDYNIPINFGVGFEPSFFGQKVHYSRDKDPWLDHRPLITDLEDLKSFEKIDFFKTKTGIRLCFFYERIKKIVGSKFNVIFPHWGRGPFGVALYICGHENLLSNLIANPNFVHKVMQLVTRSIFQYELDRAGFLGENITKLDLLNDDVAAPFLCPEHYRKFVLPYEIEISNFCNGIYYWHSCGDTILLIPDILRIPKIELLDIGLSVEKKKAIENLPRKVPLELRISPLIVQTMPEEKLKRQLTNIVEVCKKEQVEKFVLRCSGMSELLGLKEDLKKANIWIDLTREVLEGK